MHMHRRTQKCMDKTIWSDAIVGLKLDSNLFIFSEKVMQEHPLHEHHRAGVQLESPKIYTACCWLLVFFIVFFNPQPIQPFGSEQEQRGSVEDGCKQMSDVYSCRSPWAVHRVQPHLCLKMKTEKNTIIQY